MCDSHCRHLIERYGEQSFLFLERERHLRNKLPEDRLQRDGDSDRGFYKRDLEAGHLADADSVMAMCPWLCDVAWALLMSPATDE